MLKDEVRRGALGALLVIVVAGVAACGNDSSAAPGPGARGRGGRGGRGLGADRVAPVESAVAELGSIARSVTVSGVVEPIRTVGVNSQLAGALLAVTVEEGDRVTAGQPVARLDDREVSAQLVAARASFEVAQAAFDRSERLWAERYITRQEFERDRAALAAAQATVDQLETRLGYATVRAPITGVITEKHVEAGDIVGTQTRLFAIADVSMLVVRVGVSELDVVDLRAGDRVDVGLDAVPDRPMTGRIRRVFPTGDPTTRLVPVEVALDADDASAARPGFLARARFALGSRDDVVLIPASALVGAAGAEAVFVVDGERALRRSIETGLHSQGRVEVVQGLEPGEIVVTVGSHNLRDGATIRVIPPTPTAVEGSAVGDAGSRP